MGIYKNEIKSAWEQDDITDEDIGYVEMVKNKAWLGTDKNGHIIWKFEDQDNETVETKNLIDFKEQLTNKNMKKTAKQMFKELGYNLVEDSKTYLRYETPKYKGKNSFGKDLIDIDKKNKMFRLTRRSCQGNIHFKYGNLQELKAINKQVEELGWGEKENKT